MVLQNYQNFIEITSNMIHIVALGCGFKCPRKIHLNIQWGGGLLKFSGASQLTVIDGPHNDDVVVSTRSSV